MASLEAVWRRYDADEARLTAALSERMIDLARIDVGMRVLDLATGRGEPALRAAHRVGPTGRVVGIDSAASMLAMAAERAALEGLTNVRLDAMRAEDLSIEGASVEDGPFDAVLARWGLMYMDDPVAALTAARRVMKPSAPLVAAVWAEAERVSYFTLPRRALAPYRPLPAEASTTFRYAEVEVLRRDLAHAGWVIEHIEEMALGVMEAEDDASLIAWVRAFGMGRLVEGLPEAVQRAWERDVCAAAPRDPDGFVRLGGVTRILVAR